MSLLSIYEGMVEKLPNFCKRMKHLLKNGNDKAMVIEELMKDTQDVRVIYDGTKRVGTKCTDVENDKAEEVSLTLVDEMRKVVEGLAKNQETINKEIARLANALEEQKNQSYSSEALPHQSDIGGDHPQKAGLILEVPRNNNTGSHTKRKLRNEPKSAWKL